MGMMVGVDWVAAGETGRWEAGCWSDCGRVLFRGWLVGWALFGLEGLVLVRAPSVLVQVV